MRNSTRTTIAPTGTISIIAGCSSGIEPIYSAAYRHRHKLDRSDADAWYEMFDVNLSFDQYMLAQNRYDTPTSRDIIEKIADEQTTITDLVAVGALDEDALVFAGANEIDWQSHIRMQAAWQDHTDNGVSKTINLPESATVDDIADAYRYAYEQGCKGITVYRNNCRNVQVYGAKPTENGMFVNWDGVPMEPRVLQDRMNGIEKEITEELIDGLLTGDIRVSDFAELVSPGRHKLPAERNSITHKFQIAELEGYLTVGLYDDGSPGEVFVTGSKQGSTIDGLVDSVALLTSYALQYGIPLRVLCDKMRGVRFEPDGMTHNRSIPTTTSIVDYIFRWLELKFLDPKTPATFDVDEPVPAVDARSTLSGALCVDCGYTLRFVEGCSKCLRCGWSSC